jgi:hypothetical protein
MSSLIDALETILVEAHKAKGWQWVHEEPLWITWSLEKIGMLNQVLWYVSLRLLLPVTSISDIVIPYHRSLNSHIEIVDILRSHSASFEESRDAVNKWIAQPWVQEDGWEAKWEDICDAEVERWEKSW